MATARPPQQVNSYDSLEMAYEHLLESLVEHGSYCAERLFLRQYKHRVYNGWNLLLFAMNQFSKEYQDEFRYYNSIKLKKKRKRECKRDVVYKNVRLYSDLALLLARHIDVNEIDCNDNSAMDYIFCCMHSSPFNIFRLPDVVNLYECLASKEVLNRKDKIYFTMLLNEEAWDVMYWTLRMRYYDHTSRFENQETFLERILKMPGYIPHIIISVFVQPSILNLPSVNLRRRDTPLHQAAHRDNNDLMHEMISVGADVNARNTRNELPIMTYFFNFSGCLDTDVISRLQPREGFPAQVFTKLLQLCLSDSAHPSPVFFQGVMHSLVIHLAIPPVPEKVLVKVNSDAKFLLDPALVIRYGLNDSTLTAGACINNLEFLLKVMQELGIQVNMKFDSTVTDSSHPEYDLNRVQDLIEVISRYETQVLPLNQICVQVMRSKIAYITHKKFEKLPLPPDILHMLALTNVKDMLEEKFCQSTVNTVN